MNTKAPEANSACNVDSDAESADSAETIEVIEISDDDEPEEAEELEEPEVPEEPGAAAVDEPPKDDSSLIFVKHNASVFACDLQPFNGNLAVTGGQDDMAYVWDINSGEVVLTCTDHKDSVTSVGFSHEGTYLATADMGGHIQVWNLSTKTQIRETDIGDISWVKWHPKLNVLLASSITGDIYIWKIPSMSCKVLPGHNMRSECATVFPDGNRLAVGYDDGCVKVFDMKRCLIVGQVPANPEIQDSILSMDSSFDNNLLLYGDQDSHAYLMRTQTGKVAYRLDCCEPNIREGVEAVGFCKDPSVTWAATGTLDGRLTIWDISREAVRNVIQYDECITKLLWMDNSLVITGGAGGIIRLYDSRSGTVVREYNGHSNDVLDLSLSRDNRILLSCSDDKTARVFNLE